MKTTRMSYRGKKRNKKIKTCKASKKKSNWRKQTSRRTDLETICLRRATMLRSKSSPVSLCTQFDPFSK